MDKIESQPFLPQHRETNTAIRDKDKSSITSRLNFWNLFPSLVAVILFLTLVQLQTLQSHHGVFELGFPTDFVALTSAVQVEQRRFTGSIEFHPNGTAYMSMPPGSPKYFGQPGPEIDAAWHALVGGYHFYATDAEQGTLDDADFDGSKKSWYKDDIGYYQDGTAMFHTLHCVNMIRMYIDYDYYKPTFAKIAALDLRLHSEHCLDYIRQSIMCAGDLTPVPSRWHEAGAHSRAYSDSGLLHTCRAFDPIRKLVTERHNGSSAVYVKENDDI